MPQYTVTDPTSGRKVTLTGDSPPTEAELTEIFSKLPAAAPASSAPAEPEGSALGRFASNLGAQINPITMVKGFASALTPEALGGVGPVNTVKALIGAQVDQGRQAIDLAKQGRYSEAIGHGGAALVPLLGPAAANIGEQIGAGDVAGGLGGATGLVGSVLAPGAIGKVAGKARIPALAANLNPAAADAVAFGERAGIPLDAATATNNRFVQGVQHLADRSLGGSFVAEKANAAQQRGLATVGEQLAAKAHGTATTAEQAGQGVRDAVLEKLRGHAGEANTAYDKLRAIEADPVNLRTVHPEPVVPREGAPFQFTNAPKATPDAIFEGAWKDAKQQGFEGSRTELRAALADKIREAKDLKAATAGEDAEAYGHAELLKSIRELGGLKPFEMEYKPGQPAQKLTGEFENLRQLFGNDKGATSIFRKGGLGADDMAGQLQQDPRWAAILPPEGEALKSMLEDIGNARRYGTANAEGDLQHFLRGVGVQPGVSWWKQSKGPVDMALPVDLRGAKGALQPIFEDLKRQASLTPFVSGSGKARALDALDRLMTGGVHGHAPLSTVDGALSELKAFARSGAAGDVPALATRGQGVVKMAIAHLEDAAQQAAAEAGPEAVAALKAGRAATVAKYGASDVLDTLNAEPVRTHNGLIAPADGAIEHLRAVAQQAPAELPKIGRAVLDGLMEKATGHDLFGHADRVAAAWEKLGPETKRLLYRDPGYISDLDNFFHLARLTAKNANPSGTAHAVAIAHQGAALTTAAMTLNPIPVIVDLAGTAGVSKLLHSRAGVRLLTRGMRIPIGNKAAAAAWAAEASALTSSNGSQTQIPAPAR